MATVKESKEKKEETKSESVENLSYEILVENSKKFQELKRDCRLGVRLSLTGITNLVVNYEDPCLVDMFLKACFECHKECSECDRKDSCKSNRLYKLYKDTYDIDAVELQRGVPGRGFASQYLDALIFGNIEEQDSGQGLDVKVPKTDAQTGKRKRKMDGFVNRKEVLTGEFQDRLLIIKNIDYCMDFCQIKPGQIDARNLWIFDNFRNPSVRLGCRILLVTNEPLQLPFKIRTLKLDPVDEYEAQHIIDSFVQLYTEGGYEIKINESQRKQIARKLCGLTYTEAADSFSEALSNRAEINKELDAVKVVKNLREKVNRNLMEDAVGLSHLTSKPWGDYICPENSNFTFDVKKIVRDFDEINRLKEEEKKIIEKKKDNSQIMISMDSIRARMPHVIILYGRGGVGKSAFPIHFAGLLDFDVWDFNINASHSKWIGEGAENMRKALARISKASHVVVRIDEYDRAIGSTESSGQGMHEAHKQVESEFMNWLQNSQEESMFAKNDIFLVLTTNHKDNITGPLLRSGRADLVIDINEFDDKSMRETFLSSPRRMKNRGLLPPIGYHDFDEFLKSIEQLDIDKLVPLTSQKGFTVRDVDILLIEMAAHDYYFKRNKKGIPWNTEMFVKVLENSTGSIKGEETAELVLGDRFLVDHEEKKEESPQIEFGFSKDYSNKFDLTKFTDVNFFK